jgi:hypothetical protein
LGRLIGQNYSNFKKFEEETGACVELIDNAIYVSGDAKNCKKAIIKIKSKVVSF